MNYFNMQTLPFAWLLHLHCSNRCKQFLERTALPMFPFLLVLTCQHSVAKLWNRFKISINQSDKDLGWRMIWATTRTYSHFRCIILTWIPTVTLFHMLICLFYYFSYYITSTDLKIELMLLIRTDSATYPSLCTVTKHIRQSRSVKHSQVLACWPWALQSWAKAPHYNTVVFLLAKVMTMPAFPKMNLCLSPRKSSLVLGDWPIWPWVSHFVNHLSYCQKSPW